MVSGFRFVVCGFCCRVSGSLVDFFWFRIWGLGLRVKCLGFGVYDTVLRAWGLGLEVYGAESEVYGVGCRDPKLSCVLILASLICALTLLLLLVRVQLQS